MTERALNTRASHALDPEPHELAAQWAYVAREAARIADPARPAGRLLPATLSTATAELLAQPLPSAGVGLPNVLREIVEVLAPDATRTTDPRFLGLITTGNNAFGSMAEALGSALNQHVTRAALTPMASQLEAQTLRWLGEFTGYDANATGTFTSGGSMANMIALAAAVVDRAGFNVRESGLAAGPALVVYASDQTHVCVERAMSMLGLGTANYRRIGVDANARMDTRALRAAIAEDRSAGRRPICVVANAGTVMTGTVDPLDELADLCASEELWLHVDGAYGGPAARVPLAAHLFAGLHRADSFAVDAHKWLFTPYEAAAVLVKSPEPLVRAFRFGAAYLGAGTVADPMDLGPQMSRDFKALKVWSLLRGAGRDAVAACINENIAVIRRMGDAIDAHPRFERLAPVDLSIVCFRYVPDADLAPQQVDELNAAILKDILLDARIILTPASVGGRVGLRVCCVDFRFTDETAREVLKVVAELGERRFNAT